MAAKLSGGGGGKFNLGQNSDINVTPFVDVMLVLLIIFMVAAPLATVSMKVDMPPGGGNAHKPPVFINVEQQGRLYIGAAEVSRETLISQLGQAIGGPNPRNEQVMIRANRNVAYKDFMSVMDILRAGGYEKIGLITEEL